MKKILKNDKVKINLGCGQDIRVGWVNVDFRDLEGVDIVHNLDKFPYPFKDNSVDEIWMEHILEHLDNPIRCLEELFRISKPSAKITISVPHWSHFMSYCDFTHKRVCSSASFLYYEINKPSQYSKLADFEVISKKFTATRTNFKFLNPIFNPLLNLSPLFTEMLLCKFLPVTQIIFELRAKK